MQSVNLTLNKIGKYLHKHIDGAYKITTSSNTCDVYMTLLYQIPYLDRIPGKGTEYNDVHEMTIDLNLTTYQNKIRFNIIELSPDERTLGSYVIPQRYLDESNLENVKKYIYQQVIKAIHKHYMKYDILY